MRARTIGVGLIGVAYVAGCHWLMTQAPDSSWNAVVVIGPMLALLALYAGRRGLHLLTLAALATLAGLVFQGWRGGGVAPTTLYMLQHAGIHLTLATIFALTLRPGHEALVTALARRVHGSLTPAMAAYSRGVTIAGVEDIGQSGAPADHDRRRLGGSCILGCAAAHRR